jgi:hypothetical protein
MEELTDVVRSTETKQSEAASGEVGKWRIASPSSSGVEIRPASTDTPGLRSGGSVAVRWLPSCRACASPGGSVCTLETITSQASEFLNICMLEDHVIQNTLSFGSVT